MRDAGFVDLAIAVRDVDACAGCPPRYTLATKGARRLSFDFHFRAGADQLDSRGIRDLDRLVTFLHAHPGTRLRLLGFAESSPASLARAQGVADELAARGVKAERVLGLGADMPIASTDTQEGRVRNQRVEVWGD